MSKSAFFMMILRGFKLEIALHVEVELHALFDNLVMADAGDTEAKFQGRLGMNRNSAPNSIPL